MHRKKLLIALILVAVLLAAAGFARRRDKDPNLIRVSGNIEATDVEVSFRVPGRVQARAATEGTPIAAGALVATLDPTELQHESGLRLAALEEARAKLAELEAGTRREEIGQARAAADLASAEEERWRKEDARSRELYAKDVISRRELETAQTAYATARQRTRQAREALALAQNGPTRDTVEQARARVRQAAEALDAANTRLGFANLNSPISGMVLAEHVEPGEQVAAGTPVVTIGDLRNVWLRAYIDESDLGRVHLGQRVRVKTDSYPGKVYDGAIDFIASEAEFTPKSVQTEKERVKLVYRVKIAVANPRFELKPGMPADGEIVLQP